MGRYIVDMLLDGYDSDEEREAAEIEFMRGALDFSGSSVRISRLEPDNVICHPLSGARVIGRKIAPGEILLKTDVYDSTSGSWAPCPCPGIALGAGTNAIWVRPL